MSQICQYFSDNKKNKEKTKIIQNKNNTRKRKLIRKKKHINLTL